MLRVVTPLATVMLVLMQGHALASTPDRAAATASARAPRRLVGERVHDLHVTQSRVVIENGVILWRVRCFADDLEKGLRAFSRNVAFSLAADRSADSVMAAYFNASVRVDADGRRLRATMLQSSREMDPAGGGVQIYLLELRAGVQPKTVTVRNALLFDQFPSEQNLVVVLALPGERRRSLYFAAANDVAQTVTF